MEKPCPGWCWSRCREQGVRKADLHPEAFSSLLNKVCLGKESSALYKQPGVRTARRSEGKVRMMKRGLCARVLVWVDACRPAPQLPAMGPARGSRTPPGSDGREHLLRGHCCLPRSVPSSFTSHHAFTSLQRTLLGSLNILPCEVLRKTDDSGSLPCWGARWVHGARVGPGRCWGKQL